ncbi:MAG: DNA polymerase III subunit delta [Clostridia bacterium]|nr:DNA polymerase III subunit delta [Clostridia bacterium]
MNIIKEDAFRRELKKGLSGGFLFFGDEDYMKSFDLRAAREAVCPDETFAVFNDIRIDALGYSAGALLDALIPPPMMTDKKIVTVSGLNIGGLRQGELSELYEALGELEKYDYNVLVISVPAGQLDAGNLPKKPSALLTKLSEYLTPVHFEPVSGARLTSWVGKHFEHNGVTATPDVCAELVRFCGRSMFTLSAETEKLAYYVLWNGRREVTVEDIKNVSIAEISSDTFALANSIVDGRYEDAMRALEVMKFRRVDPIMIMSEVSRVVCDLVSVKALCDEGMSPQGVSAALKMNEYKAKIYVGGVVGKPMGKLMRALELCSEADLALKQSPQGYTAIERLICSL